MPVILRDRHRSRRATATDGTVRHGSRTVTGPGYSVFTVPWPYRAVERDSTVTSCQQSAKLIRNGGRSEFKARKVDFHAFGSLGYPDVYTIRIAGYKSKSVNSR